jgi:hypothetical protein
LFYLSDRQKWRYTPGLRKLRIPPETPLARLASPIWRSGSPSVGKESASLRQAAS